MLDEEIDTEYKTFKEPEYKKEKTNKKYIEKITDIDYNAFLPGGLCGSSC